MSANPPISNLPQDHPNTAARIHQYIASLPPPPTTHVPLAPPSPILPIESSSPPIRKTSSDSKEDGVILTRKAMREKEERKRHSKESVLIGEQSLASGDVGGSLHHTAPFHQFATTQTRPQLQEDPAVITSRPQQPYSNHPDYIPARLPGQFDQVRDNDRSKGKERMQEEVISETESAERRLARKMRRREKAAIMKPKPATPPPSPTPSSTSEISRHDAEGDHHTWSRELQNKGIKSRQAKGKKKRAREMVPGLSGVVGFYNAQPNPPHKRLTILPNLVGGRKTQGFLRKGKASAAVQPPDLPRQSRAFDEESFLHPPTDLPVQTDPDFDWRIKPHQKRPTQLWGQQIETEVVKPAADITDERQGVLLPNMNYKKPRLPSPGVTGSTSWPSESQGGYTSVLEEGIAVDQMPMVSAIQYEATPSYQLIDRPTRNHSPSLVTRAPTHLDLPYPRQHPELPHEMLPLTHIPQQRFETPSLASSRVPLSSDSSARMRMAYGQIVPLDDLRDSSPPVNLGGPDTAYRPYATPHFAANWREIASPQYAIPENRSNTVAIKATPIIIKVSPVGQAHSWNANSRMSQSAQPSPSTPSIRRQILPYISPIRLTPNQQAHTVDYTNAYMTPTHRSIIPLFVQQSSSPMITEYSSLQLEAEPVYNDQDSHFHGEKYEQEAYKAQMDTILAQEVEEYGANSLEYRKLWQSRRNTL